MRRPCRWLIATVGASLAFALLPAAAPAASQPSIEWTSAWNLTTHDATLGAGINPEGLSGFGAYYEFQVVTNVSEYLSEIACPPRAKLKGTDGCGPGPEVEGALPIGEVPDGMKGETVTLDLEKAGMTLKPGTTYHYRVLAVKALATEDTIQWEPPVVVGPDQTFTTPAAEAPTVEAESASHVTATGATLEATINPQDAERGALYQFQLVTEPREYPTEFTCPAAHHVFCPQEVWLGIEGEEGLPLGKTGAGVVGQGVSLDLAHAGVTLKPGTTYHYRVIAARFQQEEEGWGWEGPIVYGSDETFTTLPAKAPVIESVTVTHLTSTDATLEATIDTEGLETEYAFHMISSPCSKKGAGCELIVPIALPCCGKLFGSFVPQTVSLDLNSVGVELGEGEYIFGVTVSNEGGKTSASGGVFEAPEEPVAEPLKSTVTPGPVSNGPEVPLAGGQQPASGGGSSPPAGGSTPAAGVSAKPAHGKPSSKHGKRRKHKHHGTKAAQQSKGRKHKR
jgi:hypothetical protein